MIRASSIALGSSVSEPLARCCTRPARSERSTKAWIQTAALAIEIVSPGDDSWKKFDYFAPHHIDEVLIVDLQKRSVDWFALAGDEYQPLNKSRLIDLGPKELAERLDWPPTD